MIDDDPEQHDAESYLDAVKSTRRQVLNRGQSSTHDGAAWMCSRFAGWRKPWGTRAGFTWSRCRIEGKHDPHDHQGKAPSRRGHRRIVLPLRRDAVGRVVGLPGWNGATHPRLPER